MTPNKQSKHQEEEANQSSEALLVRGVKIPRIGGVTFTKEEMKKQIQDYIALTDKVAIIVDKDLEEIEEKRKLKELNSIPTLSEESFKIDSTNWKVIDTNIGKIKVNELGDVWEYTEGEFKGEQIFTQDAAIRETEKLGKILPTIEQLGAIIKSIDPNIDLSKGWQDDNTEPSIRETLGVKLVGYRWPNGGFYYRGRNVCLWSGTPGFGIGFDETRVYPRGGNDSPYGFSVFCLAKN